MSRGQARVAPAPGEVGAGVDRPPVDDDLLAAAGVRDRLEDGLVVRERVAQLLDAHRPHGLANDQLAPAARTQARTHGAGERNFRSPQQETARESAWVGESDSPLHPTACRQGDCSEAAFPHPSGASCPRIIRKRVDLPAPFPPMIPTTPAFGSWKSSPPIKRRSPKPLTSCFASMTTSPRRGPTGIVMESSVEARTKAFASSTSCSYARRRALPFFCWPWRCFVT